MQTLIGIIVGLIVLTLLIVAHEYGHFRAARRNGVRVLEFAVGFGPHIAAWLYNPEYIKWKKSNHQTPRPKRLVKLPHSEWGKPQDSLILSINWLPLGGYCQMDGESDADTRKNTFGAASFWGKTKILFAGVAMNWLVAFLVFTILAWTGMPHFLNNQFQIESDTSSASDSVVTVVEIVDGSPAKTAGFQVDDTLVGVADESTYQNCLNTDTTTANSLCPFAYPIASANIVTEFNSAHAGQKVFYAVTHKDEDKINFLEVNLNPEGSDYFLGIKMAEYGQVLYYSTWSAPIVGAGTTIQLTIETIKGVGGLIGNLVSGVVRQFSSDDTVREAGREAIGTAGDSVSGPIGIVGVLFPAFTSAGPTNLAFLAALISVSLACMNILPIPALDGGRWLLIAIARLRGKRLKKETEEKIVSRAFIVLLALFFLICVLDIVRLF